MANELTNARDVSTDHGASAQGTVLLGFVGDVLVDRPEPEQATEHLVEHFAPFDAVMANSEGVYVDDPEVSCNATMPIMPPRRNLDALRQFDVITLANNHTVDAGHTALLQMIEGLHELGVATIGAGKDIEAARAPAILELKGTSVGYLGYSSNFPPGYEAKPGWAGIAPMRAENHYRPLYPNMWSPGTPPIVVTVPLEDDLAGLANDLAQAREQCAIVVATFHWGDFSRPYVITDHERRTARFCVDHGADIVIGHHHHLLRGAEWYNGRPIFYGLGHFIFDMSDPRWKLPMPAGETAMDYGIFPRDGWPLLGMHPDARMSTIAWVEIDSGLVVGAGMVPCRIDPQGQVRPVAAMSEQGQEIRQYVARSNELAGISQELTFEPATCYGAQGSWRLVASTGDGGSVGQRRN